MSIAPANVAELTRQLLEAARSGRKIDSVDTKALCNLIEHKAEDMTATVQAGIALEQFQQQLSVHGQWLPIDPPGPRTLTLREILENNVSGPRRFGYGTIRDYVIGLSVALADGRVVHSGGKVVKNVAGYDLMKLFIGSRGALGIIVEVTFKVLPLPETETFIEVQCESLDGVAPLLEKIFDSELAPKVLDVHKLAGARRFSLVLGFAGTRPEVEWQLSTAAKIGVNQPSSLDYEQQFFSSNPKIQKTSVLPSKLIDAVQTLGNTPFVARAGNGVIFHGGSAEPTPRDCPTDLEQRLKIAFDPKQILRSL